MSRPQTSPSTPRRLSSLTLPKTPSSVSTLSGAAGGNIISPRRSPAPETVTSPSPSPSPGLPGKGRARDLLRKHYGLGLGVPAASGRPNDPMDVDSSAFDAKSYYEQLITTASLPTLLKRENDLVTEIRQLDSERQSLVYNHHHELIAASDTIRAMKSRAESLDSDLEKLKVAFSEISRISTDIAVENESKMQDTPKR